MKALCNSLHAAGSNCFGDVVDAHLRVVEAILLGPPGQSPLAPLAPCIDRGFPNDRMVIPSSTENP